MIGLILMILSVVLFLVTLGAFITYYVIKSPEKVAASKEGSAESKSLLVKKYDEVNVKKQSTTLLLLAFCFPLLFVIGGFMFVAPQGDAIVFNEDALDDEFELEPPQTKQVPPPPPPPPPPELEIVADEEILEEEPEIEDIEVEEDEIVEAPEEEEEEEAPVEQEIFTIVEDMPIFAGCEGEGSKAAKEECSSLKIQTYLAGITYPPMAYDNDIEGKVFVRFVVDDKGAVTDVSVARGADPILDKAAIAHVKKMPKWTPGKQRGKPAKVQYVVPMNFQIN